MSHRHDCPDRWEARREGERASERGYGCYSNPYADRYHDGRGCEEAERNWEEGYRQAEYERHELERDEEEIRARQVRERREQEEIEYYQEMEDHEQQRRGDDIRNPK